MPITDSGYGSAICMLQRLNILLRLPFSTPSFHSLLTSEYVLRRNKQEQKFGLIGQIGLKPALDTTAGR